MNGNNWKYISFVLMAVIAIPTVSNVIAPQAFADTLSTILAKINTIYSLVVANLDVKVSTRATQTSVDNLQTTAGTIKSKTDNLPSDPASNIEVDTRASQASINGLQDQIIRLQDQNAVIQGKITALPLGTIIIETDVVDGTDGTFSFQTNATAPFTIVTSGGVGTYSLNGLQPGIGINIRISSASTTIANLNSNSCVNLKGNNIIVDTGNNEVVNLVSSASVVKCTWTYSTTATG